MPKLVLKFNADDKDTFVFVAQTAHALKVAHPKLWDDFMRAFQSTADHHIKGVVNLPPASSDVLQHLQGRARAYWVLTEALDDCTGVVRRYEDKCQAIENKEKSNGTSPAADTPFK